MDLPPGTSIHCRQSQSAASAARSRPGSGRGKFMGARRGGGGLEACEALAPSAGAFLFAAMPTLAEVCLVPQLTNARRFGSICRSSRGCSQQSGPARNCRLSRPLRRCTPNLAGDDVEMDLHCFAVAVRQHEGGAELHPGQAAPNTKVDAVQLQERHRHIEEFLRRGRVRVWEKREATGSGRRTYGHGRSDCCSGRGRPAPRLCAGDGPRGRSISALSTRRLNFMFSADRTRARSLEVDAARWGYSWRGG